MGNARLDSSHPDVPALASPRTFDVVVTNPPFQNRARRGRTPHKVWIEFTERELTRLVSPGGLLLQISPASFQSPSNRVLRLLAENDTRLIDFDAGRHFPGVGSSFAYYAVRRGDARGPTQIVRDGVEFEVDLAAGVRWLPNDLNPVSLVVHRRVMWGSGPRLDVRHDYVTGHNTRLGTTLSRTPTAAHRFAMLHTNTQTWWSSVEQEWAQIPKVMWSRSGYTRPQVDLGTQGGTDMVYYVPCASADEARCLGHNLTRSIFRYIFATARWSGFGSEVVFASLPDLPRDRQLSDEETFDRFGLSEEERAYVTRRVG